MLKNIGYGSNTIKRIKIHILKYTCNILKFSSLNILIKKLIDEYEIYI